jgi:hypothetical protein
MFVMFWQTRLYVSLLPSMCNVGEYTAHTMAQLAILECTICTSKVT